ncbi:MAG TPA: endonuclease/exonuclease/phosphatase family protein [Arachnia sp.]|nr:endonuclease/exonuclease/phosphatase family protein [Arachnia sp.]HMT85390.1 endonuclease/exonuclease/phosphatase family protein [Arachnia sp.]
MRLVTFNLWSGRSAKLGASAAAAKGTRRWAKSVDLDLLRAAVRELDPDVLALQEVDVGQSRSHHADLTGIAAEAMGAREYRFVPTLAGTPGALWSLSGPLHRPTGQYGIALLSRYPALRWQDVPLPALRPSVKVMLPVVRQHLTVGEEPRAAIIANLDTPHGRIAVANTHLTWIPGSGIRQLREVTRYLGEFADPVLLVGDFNMWGPLPRMITGFRPLAEHATYPATRPSRQLDHIMLRGHGPSVAATRAVRVAVSDHLALVVDFA